VWRIDTVFLLVLAFALVPMSMGRWRPGKPEGVILILFFVAYLVLWRWGSWIA
jgi:hypothetical protein